MDAALRGRRPDTPSFDRRRVTHPWTVDDVRAVFLLTPVHL
jgi:hypothetical protein